jgi:hypothetical protein
MKNSPHTNVQGHVMRILTLLGILLVGSVLESPVALAQSQDPPEVRLQQIAQIASDKVRSAQLQKLLAELQNQQDSTDRNDEAISRLLFSLATTDVNWRVRNHARKYLLKNPHYSMIELAATCLKELPPSQSGAPPDFVPKLLAALKSPEVIPYFFEILLSCQGRVEHILDNLAKVGTNETLIRLEEMENDPLLTQTILEIVTVEYEKKHGHLKGARLAESMAQIRTQQIRESLPVTIAQLRSRLEGGWFIPFALDDLALSHLKLNGFVVTPEQKNEMFEFYDGEFPYVTTDVVMHTFMIQLRGALEGLEQQGLRQDVAAFCRTMSLGSLEQAERMTRNAAARESALSNAAFFAVPALLCTSKADTVSAPLTLPPSIKGRVDSEIILMQAEAGPSYSPVTGLTEDYARYRPRGRFADRGQTAANYFRAITWLGRQTFLLREDEGTRRALLMLDVLDWRPEARDSWARIDDLLTTLFGEPDDGSFHSYEAALAATGGGTEPGRVGKLLARADGLDRFRGALELDSPRINTAYLDSPSGTSWPKEAKGLRVFGQRYTSDSHLLQKVMDDGNWPVSGLHVMAGMAGSQTAREILAGSDLGPLPDDLPVVDPEGGLVDQTLHCLAPLFTPEERAHEMYRSTLWQEKQVNTALGSWAEVRHATSPYTKDATMYLGLLMAPDRIYGYVEPYPEFYRRLQVVAERLHGILQERDIYRKMAAAHTDSALFAELTDPRAQKQRFGLDLETAQVRLKGNHLPDFMALLKRLEDLSVRQLADQPHTEADGHFLKAIGKTLQKLGLNNASTLHARHPMSRVIDVATEYQSGTCLEVAVSRPLAIYVVAHLAGQSVVCKGAVYNYHEFLWPVNERLTDKQWQTMDGNLDFQNRPPWLGTRKGMGLVRPAGCPAPGGHQRGGRRH